MNWTLFWFGVALTESVLLGLSVIRQFSLAFCNQRLKDAINKLGEKYAPEIFRGDKLV